MDGIVIRPWRSIDSRTDRGAGDRLRHREKVRKAIRENIGEIVGEESIIGKDKDKIIKVPIRGIKEYRFVYGDNMPGVAEGEGDEATGRDLGPVRKDGDGPGKAGNQPGEDYYETEITLEELIDILFEDLELPEMEKKKIREIIVEAKRKNVGFRKVGIWPRLSFPRTARERVKRLKETRRALMEKEQEIERLKNEGNGEEAAAQQEEITALREVLRILSERGAEAEEAREYLKLHPREKGRFPFRNEDKRFRHRKPKPRRESNAVVTCIMDTSGSMDTVRKYLARSFFLLLYMFVKSKYRHVEVVFVAHDTEGRVVTENEFFHKGQSGGTNISSGYEKALEVIEQHYNPLLWDVYAFHCSDGDNFSEDNDRAVALLKKLCEICNLVGYGEIKPQQVHSEWESSMMKLYAQEIKAENFSIVRVTGKSDIWPAFKGWLAKERVAEMEEPA